MRLSQTFVWCKATWTLSVPCVLLKYVLFKRDWCFTSTFISRQRKGTPLVKCRRTSETFKHYLFFFFFFFSVAWKFEHCLSIFCHFWSFLYRFFYRNRDRPSLHYRVAAMILQREPPLLRQNKFKPKKITFTNKLVKNLFLKWCLFQEKWILKSPIFTFKFRGRCYLE